MATKKAAGVPAVKQNTAVVSWRDKLAGYAKQEAAQADEVGAGGQFLSFKSGVLSYNQQPCAGNQLDVIIVASMLENAFYGNDFDPDNPQPPVCYAFGSEKKQMRPHEKSAQPQAESCEECGWNEFGSADKGKGKACKNVVRLAVLPAKPLDPAVLENVEAAYAKTPVTSSKGYAAYVKGLAAKFEMPPFAFVTKLAVVPDAKTQFKVTFEEVAALADNDEIMNVLEQRHLELSKTIDFPYPEAREEEEKPKGKAAAAKGRAAAPSRTRKY